MKNKYDLNRILEKTKQYFEKQGLALFDEEIEHNETCTLMYNYMDNIIDIIIFVDNEDDTLSITYSYDEYYKNVDNGFRLPNSHILSFSVYNIALEHSQLKKQIKESFKFFMKIFKQHEKKYKKQNNEKDMK